MAVKKKLGCLKRCAKIKTAKRQRYVKWPGWSKKPLPRTKKTKLWAGNQKWLEKFLRDYAKVAEAEDAAQAKEAEEAARADEYWRLVQPAPRAAEWPPEKPKRPKKPTKKPVKKPVKKVKAKPEPIIPEDDIDVERFKRLAEDAAKAATKGEA